MQLRKASLSDVGGIARVEEASWYKAGAATVEQIRSRIVTFPDGVIVAVENNEVVGVVVGEIINSSYLDKEDINWSDITDGGTIKSTHDPNGDALFGVDLSVDPSRRNSGVGALLLQEIGKMAIKRNLRIGVLGARMPDYHKYSKDYTPEEYIRAINIEGKLLDSELRFYRRNGLSFYRVVKDYFPDPESLNYGVICIWKNPFYVKNKFLGSVIGFIGSLIFRI